MVRCFELVRDNHYSPSTLGEHCYTLVSGHCNIVSLGISRSANDPVGAVMAASSCNYLVIYDGISQVYSTASEATALASVPPKGTSTEDKHVLFITFEPDDKKLVVYEVDKKEVEDATNEAILVDMEKKAAAKKAKEAKLLETEDEFYDE